MITKNRTLVKQIFSEVYSQRNNKIVYLICFFICLFFLSFGYTQDKTEDTPDLFTSELFKAEMTVSMDFKDVSIRDILKAFSIQAGVNFIASQEIEDRKVTLYLENVPLKSALDQLFKANGLDYDFDDKAKIILVKKAFPVQEYLTKVYSLKYACVSSSAILSEVSSQCGSDGGGSGDSGGDDEVSGITEVIESLLSEGEKVIEDARTNRIIITAAPNKFPIIEKTLLELDVPVPQVMIEVEMLDVSKNDIDRAGFEMPNNPITLTIPGGLFNRGAAFFFGTLNKKGAGLNDTTCEGSVEGSVIIGNTYAHLLDFLRSRTDTKYLARPRILTLNNETAEIKIVSDEVIGEEFKYDDQGNVTSRCAERTRTGVSLRITPQVNLETGEITMFISPKVTEAAASEFGGTYRDPEERTTNSLVRIRDGETVVAGGLIRDRKYITKKKVPFLGDIPILGLLFRHRNNVKDSERELLVFITPHIIKDDVTLGSSTVNNDIFTAREQDVFLK